MRLATGRLLPLAFLWLVVVANSTLINAAELHKDEGLQIEIISPNDGEIFYASKLGYIVSIPITGFVTGLEGSPESVDVQLTIWSVHGSTEPLRTRPDKSGHFVFYLDLNPDNEPLPTVGERFFYYSENCADCHFATHNELPLGPLRLEFTATTADGQQATAEKRMTVDRSQYATIPVEVIVDGGGETSLDRIPVQAETRLYEWRGRRFMELTDGSGRANLRVEALSQRDTRYLLSVPPTLIDNRRYQSVETVEIVLVPGEEMTEPVEIAVVVESGTITVGLDAPSDLSEATVLAIALPSGTIYREKIQEDATFAFGRLPLGEYLISVDSREAGEDAVTAQPVLVDLLESPAAEVTLSLDETSGADLAGRLVDETGRPIPFGWLSASGESLGAQASPLNGRFLLSGVEDEQATISITAPGFWGRSNRLSDWTTNATDAGVDITLFPRTDRQEIDWGDGQILVPQESVVVETDDGLSLVRGWIWGHNERPDPFIISVEGASLEIDAADFALEFAPGEASWIYVKGGQVVFNSREGTASEIMAGEMMAFGDGVPTPYPVAADEVTIDLLRKGRKPTVPLLYEEEPSASQRFGDFLAAAGRLLSQGLVAVTYLVMFVMIIGAILYGARRLLQSRS